MKESLKFGELKKMTEFIINAGVTVFGLCSLSAILNQKIQKTIVSWIFLIGIVVTCTSMIASPMYYSESFAGFSIFAAVAAIHFTRLAYKRGKI